MAITQVYDVKNINGRNVYLPSQPTNQVNTLQSPIPITPYVITTGILDVSTTFGEVYSITVPVATYIVSMTIIPSSSDVSFILFYGDYSIGNTINNATFSTSISVDFPSPFFPLIPQGSVIQLLAVSTTSGQTIQMALQGMQMQVVPTL